MLVTQYVGKSFQNPYWENSVFLQSKSSTTIIPQDFYNKAPFIMSARRGATE